MNNETVLHQSHPAMFRNRPILFCILVTWAAIGSLILVLALVSIVTAGSGNARNVTLITIGICIAIAVPPLLILITWFLRCMGTTFTVTDKRTALRYGIIARHETEVLHAHVRNIVTSQGVMQRLTGVGSIGISSSGQAGFEISVFGIRNPSQIKALIEKYRPA